MNAPDSNQIYFDWSLVQSLDPQSILRQNNLKAVRSFVKMFLNSDFAGIQSSSFPNPGFPKLFVLIQATIEYLLRSQKELKNLLNEAAKKYSEATEEISKLEQRENNSRKLLHTLQTQGETCAICGKRFKNLGYIDKHIINRHNEFSDIWAAIRNNNPNLNIILNSNNGNPNISHIQNQHQQLHSNQNQNSNQKAKPILKFMKCDTVDIKTAPPKVYEPVSIEIDEMPPENHVSARTPHQQNDYSHKSNGIASSFSNTPNIPHLDIYEKEKPHIVDDMTQGQMDTVANFAAGNIIKEMTEIANTHKMHNSTPQTPNKHHHSHINNPSNSNNNVNNNNNSNSNDYDYETNEGKNTNRSPETLAKSVSRQAETPPANLKKRAQQNQQQNIQSIQNISQQQDECKTNRVHRNQNRNPNRPSSSENAHHSSNHSNNQSNNHSNCHSNSSSEPNSNGSSNTTSNVTSSSNLNANARNMAHSKSKDNVNLTEDQPNLQEADPFVIPAQADTMDPFLIDNEESPTVEEEETTNLRQSQQVDFTNAELDELIQNSDNEDENDKANTSVENVKQQTHSQQSPNSSQQQPSQQASPMTPKKKRRKHRKATTIPEDHLPEIPDPDPQPEVKFNFHGTQIHAQQQHSESQNQAKHAGSKSKMSGNKGKKPSVTFITEDENIPEQNSIKEIPTSPPKQPDQPVIGIVKRTDVGPIPVEEDYYDDVPPARMFEEKSQPKRMGGYQITNSELDELIPESSDCE
ncbi:hypothetical protein TRFO_17921 [Tritrichomonas foetus]|uniref:C2H2-type domain-containing protein n=1 Tax=Tritrichomonas foetus TaxID=1144522 RepID=A0A1J4KMF7_9EUKA|nr:hypothetical protein TRFO_17921 [Tritrichomonas foetus]|eukprot:OHT12330.1 hypothetical protein TRFO_17921 [Tritrichomonas foetus]